jgi:hypothetical protein
METLAQPSVLQEPPVVRPDLFERAPDDKNPIERCSAFSWPLRWGQR